MPNTKIQVVGRCPLCKRQLSLDYTHDKFAYRCPHCGAHVMSYQLAVDKKRRC